MIITLRIDKREENKIGTFASKRRINRSQAIKELLDKGFMLSQLQEYRNGALSLGRLSEILEISVVETINLVARYNAHPSMPYDYLTDAREYGSKLKQK